MKNNLIVILIAITLISCASDDTEFEISSPGGKVTAELGIEKSGDSLSGRLFYKLKFEGKDVLDSSIISLEFKNMPRFGDNLKITGSERKSLNESWERVWGKRKVVENHYNEIVLAVDETVEPFRQINLVLRAYHDGAAFRYELPEQTGLGQFELASENTEFNFKSDYKAWAVNYGGYASHQEGLFQHINISGIDTNIIGMPLTIKVSDSCYASITEAELTDWAGMYLSGTSDPTCPVTKLSPRLDDPSILVKSTTPTRSPWRVIMLADSPGGLIESDLISNLNEPCQIEDPSWIKPGKSAWDWWWSNSYAPDAGFKLGSNTKTMKYFIDFAAEMGWKYQLVDWYWYGPPFVEPIDWSKPPIPTPDADITTMNPDIDIHELVKYANSKNVKLLLWLEWHHADKQMEKAFPLYEKWGIAGVKVDFMARDDQQIVEFYHRLVKLAARYHLLVDFHGAYKPTGFSRTYPNLITREGVMGNEYSKWSSNITPEHKVTLPFTRGLLGEMDFTPGSFVNTTIDKFKTESPGHSPMTIGTRCNQLALLVVYESALQVLCDSPYNYRHSPAGLDFLEVVPTTWDDTKVINADIGNYITVARRSGDDWYIGSLTDGTERILEIPLEYLDNDKTYTAHIWKDAPDADVNPTHLVEEEIQVDSKMTITAELSKGGGHVIRIFPDTK